MCSSKIELVVCSSKIELASHIVCSKSAEPLRDKLEKWKWTNFSEKGATEGMSFSYIIVKRGRFLFLDVQNYFGEGPNVYQLKLLQI